MGTFLFPDEYYNSSYDINFNKYFRKGYRAVLFDIDNTLVPHGFPNDERSVRLLKKLQRTGFKICFISNNDFERVESFNHGIGADFIYKAGKPKPDKFIKAMDILGTAPETTLFVGDQLFTDMWGANNAKLHSILVKPIDSHEDFHIRLKRLLEIPFLIAYLLIPGHNIKKDGKYQS